ncbi:MAG: rhomboid family intramembrane serine protease [Alphaproteobacteria bacterium]|nr:rhomboid family intramembrane serine protease [Alphaproteobacteria bacterium]
MFLPIGDHPNPQGYKAWMTWALIAANVLVYLLVALPLSAQGLDPSDPAVRDWLQLVAPSMPRDTPLGQLLGSMSAYELFIFEHGFKPAAPALDDLFASLFLHAGLGHLAGNMLFLWIYGDNVEHRLGRIPFLLSYLLTGAAATLAFAALAGDSMTPLVGASGAISGVLGFYFLLFPRNKVKVFIFFFPFVMQSVYISARVVLGVYVVFSNLLPLLSGSESSVAYGAHLGGFFAGLALAWVGERLDWRVPRPAPASEDMREAPRMSPDQALDAAERMAAEGRHDEANRLLRRALGGNPDPRQLARVRLQLGLMRLQQRQPAAAYHHLVEAMELAPGTEIAAQAEAALVSVWGAAPRR